MNTVNSLIGMDFYKGGYEGRVLAQVEPGYYLVSVVDEGYRIVAIDFLTRFTFERPEDAEEAS